MPKLENLIGRRYGKLTVIAHGETEKSDKCKSTRHTWICQCDCGSPAKQIRGDHLKAGLVISCGCVRKERSKKAIETHKQAHTRLYYVWCNMKNRCYNPNVRSYKTYGKRGIKVCEEWKNDFGSFSKWAFANGYDPNAAYGKCTIDRIDNNADYTPMNCRFVDLKAQANNRGRWT